MSETQTQRVRIHLDVTSELSEKDAWVAIFELFGRDMRGEHIYGLTEGEDEDGQPIVSWYPVSVEVVSVDSSQVAEGVEA